MFPVVLQFFKDIVRDRSPAIHAVPFSERIPFLFLALPLNQHGFSVDANFPLMRFLTIFSYFSRNSTPLVHLGKNQKALNQLIKSLFLYSAGESNSDCKIENLEY